MSRVKKRALLRKMLESKGLKGSTQDAVPRRDPSVEVPLSHSQERQWFLQRLEGQTGSYNLAHAMRMTGDLNVVALKQVFQEITDRHEILRTRFEDGPMGPIQVIAKSLPVDIAEQDLTHLSAQAQEQAVAEQINTQKNRPFDLTAPPLFEASLLKLDESHHVLVLTMHHIITDGWSLGVLFGELAANYNALCSGTPLDQPPLAVQYGDFAAWQRKRDFGSQLDYWKQHLQGLPGITRLPLDKPRPAVHSLDGASVDVVFPSDVTAGLENLAKTHGASLYMALQAVLFVMLHRYCDQNRLSVGVPIANRNRKELEPLIGFFLNTLVLRADLDDNPSFETLLSRVKEAALAAYKNQDVPFEKIVKAMVPERTQSYTPLFQVLFLFHNTPATMPPMTDLEVSAIKGGEPAANFDLNLELHQRGDLIEGALVYSPHLFEASTVERMAGHLVQLTRAAAANPSVSVGDLQLLDEEELKLLLETWNDSTTIFPHEHSLPQLFEQVALRTPDAPAAADENEALSYQQLSQQVDIMAGQLATMGIGHGDLVGIFAHRSLDFLIGILGTFKAGAAYIPIDPEQPTKRIKVLLQESRCRLVLTDSNCQPTLETVLTEMVEPPQTELLSQLRAKETNTSIESPATPDSLAYVIFTSGSTGTPKGAMVHHRGMVNHIYAKIKDLGITANDIIAQNAPQHFDISVWQFLCALLAGGKTQVFSEDVSRDPVVLPKEVARTGVTVFEVVPTMLQMIIEHEENFGILSDLRWLMLTGEALPAPLAGAWLKRCPQVPIVNAYGPTECSDDVTHHIFNEPPNLEMPVPIGLNVQNIRLYVLDKRLNLVPPGALGELHVAGVGLGRGYLNQPVKTANVFIPNHLEPESGTRLYKTGDLVRHIPHGALSGTLEFLGRLDHQIKIRGFRIEIGEIEAQLDSLPQIARSVVICHGEGERKRLIAFIQPSDPADVQNDSLVKDVREAIRASVPDYMVPSQFVCLETLPTTPNGKIDRLSIAKLEVDGDEPWAEDRTPPRNETEVSIAEAFAETLERNEPIGIHTSFFEMGGHSLLATRVLLKLQHNHGIEIPLRFFFDAPTVAGLAEYVNSVQWASQSTDTTASEEEESWEF